MYSDCTQHWEERDDGARAMDAAHPLDSCHHQPRRGAALMSDDGSLTLIERDALLRELEQLFYLEADLLDERRYEEWLELLGEDFQYAMPLRLNVKFDEVSWRENTRAGSEVLWVDENKATMAQRVQQILTGAHWAEEPLSRVSHMISNIRLKHADADSASLSSRFLVYRNRVESETDILVGRRLDWLSSAGGSWRFVRREVLLDQNVLLAKNLTVFI